MRKAEEKRKNERVLHNKEEVELQYNRKRETLLSRTQQGFFARSTDHLRQSQDQFRQSHSSAFSTMKPHVKKEASRLRQAQMQEQRDELASLSKRKIMRLVQKQARMES